MRAMVALVIVALTLAPVCAMAGCRVTAWDGETPRRIQCGSLRLYALTPHEAGVCMRAVEQATLLPEVSSALRLCDDQRGRLLGSQEDLSFRAMELQREVEDLREKAGSRWRWLEVVGISAIVGVLAFAGGVGVGVWSF